LPVAIVSFDLDGTLIDSLKDLARALNRALAEVSLPPHPEEAVRTFIGSGARNLVERALAAYGRAELADEVLAGFRQAYHASLIDQTTVYPGVLEALDALRGRAALVVSTNKPGIYARPLVDTLLPGRIARTYGPDDVGALKPDPAMLHRVERELGGRVVAHVGDSHTDIETASAHGCAAIAVAWGLSPADALTGARQVLDRPEQLVAAILPFIV
jgi:phosphoglycolate phosphatase